MQDLIHEVQPADTTCSVEEFIDADNDIPTCMDTSAEDWEDVFLDEVAGPSANFAINLALLALES